MNIKEGYMPFMGTQTYYRMVGNKDSQKKPLVLLHGGPGSTHNYFEVLDSLAELDDRLIIAYDQIGCGNSYIEGRPELWTSETWVNELIALRTHLGIEECHLLGQSWGGMLLLDYLCNYKPKGISSAVLSSTLPASWLWSEEQKRMIKFLPKEMQDAIEMATQTGDYSSPAYQAAEAEYMLRHSGEEPSADAPECLRRQKTKGRESYVIGWGPNEFTPQGTLKEYDVIHQLKDITAPALIINGGNDLCTPYVAKVMYDGIPNSRWEIFPNCRHVCFVEDTPRYTALLIEWLNAND